MNRSKESCLLLLICLTLLLFVTATCAQEQYKKLARDSISQIVDGKYDAAIKDSETYLDKYPKDLESMYGTAFRPFYGRSQRLAEASDRKRRI
jgi:hypothetical protein